jgi:transposase
MAQTRKSARTFSKSDPIDALAVARAAIREPDLPQATMPGIEYEIGLLVDHRNDLVTDSTGHQRRLRWHLHELDPDLKIPASGLTNPANLQKTARRLQRLPQSTQVRICRELVRRIAELNRRAVEIKRELAKLVKANAPQLLQIVGFGTLCAAAILAEIAGINRFGTEAQLASYAGVARLDASSGRQQRHRLNRTLHVIAVTQIRMHPPAMAYYARRQSEGKTNREALRTLKRYIARTVFNTRKNAMLDT